MALSLTRLAQVCSEFSRNELNFENWNFSHKGNYDQGKHAYQWGLGYDKTLIKDKLNEWEFQDSAGYSLPYQSRHSPIEQGH